MRRTRPQQLQVSYKPHTHTVASECLACDVAFPFPRGVVDDRRMHGFDKKNRLLTISLMEIEIGDIYHDKYQNKDF